MGTRVIQVKGLNGYKGPTGKGEEHRLLTNRGPDQSGSCLISIWQSPDQSGRCLILIRWLPDQSGSCLIKIWQLPDQSGSHLILPC